MSQKILLTEYIFDLSVLGIIFIDDVTCMFNREDQLSNSLDIFFKSYVFLR